MGNCLSESASKEEDLHSVNVPRTHASHMAVNPLGKVVQFGEIYTAMTENDPIASAEQLLKVDFLDNGIEPLSKAVSQAINREKAGLISRNARFKLQSLAIEEVVEAAVDFD